MRNQYGEPISTHLTDQRVAGLDLSGLCLSALAAIAPTTSAEAFL